MIFLFAAELEEPRIGKCGKGLTSLFLRTKFRNCLLKFRTQMHCTCLQIDRVVTMNWSGEAE